MLNDKILAETLNIKLIQSKNLFFFFENLVIKCQKSAKKRFIIKKW